MYTCADCTVLACDSGNREHMPSNCPMQRQEKLEECLKEYHSPPILRILCGMFFY